MLNCWTLDALSAWYRSKVPKTSGTDESRAALLPCFYNLHYGMVVFLCKQGVTLLWLHTLCGKVCCQGIPLVNHWIKCLQLHHDLPSNPLDKSKAWQNNTAATNTDSPGKCLMYYINDLISVSFFSVANCKQERLVFADIFAHQEKKIINHSKIIQFLWQLCHSAIQVRENGTMTFSDRSLDCAAIRTKCQPIKVF